MFSFSKIEKSCVWVEAKNPVATARGSDPEGSCTSTSIRDAYVSASHPRAEGLVSDEISSHLTIRKYQLSSVTSLTSFSEKGGTDEVDERKPYPTCKSPRVSKGDVSNVANR
jgi:hypothetical protein